MSSVELYALGNHSTSVGWVGVAVGGRNTRSMNVKPELVA